MVRRAIFLDRDGVLNQMLPGKYVHEYKNWKWMPGAIDAINRFYQEGWIIIVVTNQRGIGLGHLTMAMFIELMRTAEEDLTGCWHSIYVCPHVEDCECRKPKPGMLIGAMFHHQLLPENCLMVGDMDTDIQAAAAAGVEGYLYDGSNLEIFIENTPRYKELRDATLRT